MSKKERKEFERRQEQIRRDRADYRLPILLEFPIKHREIISEPMLGEIDMEKYLATGLIEHVTCGGESGYKARPCDFRWIQDVRRQCIRHGVSFYFKQTPMRGHPVFIAQHATGCCCRGCLEKWHHIPNI